MKKRINKRGIYLLCSCVLLLGLFVMNHNIAHAYTEELITNTGIVYPISLATGEDARGKTIFPDEEFLAYIRQATFLSGVYSGYSFDLDEDNYLSKEECETVRILFVTGNEKICDLTGVEAFPKLRELRCGGTNIRRLDLTKNPRLKELSAYDTPLRELNVSECPLLQSLDVRNASLTSLHLENNTALQTVFLHGQKRDSYGFVQDKSYHVLLMDSDTMIEKARIRNVQIDGAPGDGKNSVYNEEEAEVCCSDAVKEITYVYDTGHPLVKQLPVTLHISTAYRQEYDTQGGNKVLAQYFKKGTIDTAPEVPKRPGYLFTGWHMSVNDETIYPFGQEVKKNSKLYATWKKRTYQVIYDANGGVMSQQKYEGTVDYWSVNLLPSAQNKPKRNGYVLIGFETESGILLNEQNQSGISYGQIAGNADTDSTVLRARWASNNGYRLRLATNLSTVQEREVFDASECEVGGLTWDSDDYVDWENEPTLAGYRFEGWYTAKTGGTKVTPQTTYGNLYATQFAGDSIGKVPTLYARFSIRQLTIIYNVLGGTKIANRQNVVWGSSHLLPKKQPKKKNYKFAGWWCGKNVTSKTKTNEISDGNSDTITLTAIWIKKYEKKGTIFTRYGVTYKITKSDKKGQRIRLIKVKKGKKIVYLRNKIFYNGKFFKLTSIQKGSLKKVKKIVFRMTKKQKKKYKKLVKKSGKKV